MQLFPLSALLWLTAACGATINNTLAPQAVVNVNAFFDSLVDDLRRFFVDNELDPMSLPDYKEGFRIKLLLIAVHGELWLTDGWFRDLATLRRAGDAVVEVTLRTLDARCVIGFDLLKMDYDYKAKLMDLGPKGGVEAKIKDMIMEIDLRMDLKTNLVTLNRLEITHTGRVDVKFTGTILLDLLANTISDVITVLFKNVIVNVIETKVREAIKKALDQKHFDPFIAGLAV